MSFWVKHRFLVAISIFIISSVGALLMIKNDWPAGTDFRYPLVIAVIGLGFTLAQFLFQIWESKFSSDQSAMRDSFRELIKSFSERIQNLNEVLGDRGETTFKRFLIEHTRFSNNIRQEYTLYVPMFFRKVDTLEEYKSFFATLNKMDVLIKSKSEDFHMYLLMPLEYAENRDHHFKLFIKEYHKEFDELAERRTQLFYKIRKEYLMT